MFQELWEFINYFMEPEELVFAGIGLVVIIVIFIMGGKQEKIEEKEKKEMQKTNRKVDELGRIVLPIEMRKKLGIEPKNNLFMILDGDGIILEKGQEVNELGMITIPFHIRTALGIETAEELEVEMVEERIILRKKSKDVEKK